MRLIAAAVVLLLVLAFGAWKQQDAPLTVTCGSVTGGTTATVKGVTWARKAGSWLHNVAENPDQYENPHNIKRTLDGMFKKVLWAWLTAGVQSARGEKVDPQILKLEQDRAQALADAAAACCPSPTPPPPDQPEADEWDPRTAAVSSSRYTTENLTIAKVAVKEARRAGLPERAAVVNLAAGFQESGVRNLSYGHSSSVGYLQLINTHGSVAQRMDPTFSARWFYRGLEGVRGWEQMSVTRAAQSVQQSAFPDAYARWEDDARKLIAAAGGFGPKVEARIGATDPEAPGYTAGGCVPPGQASEVDVAEGKVQTVAAPGDWNFPRATVRGCGHRVDAGPGPAEHRRVGRRRCLRRRRSWPMGTQAPPRGRRRRPAYYAIGQLAATCRTGTSSHGKGDAPRGALVFRDTANPAGHIAISNGDGRDMDHRSTRPHGSGGPGSDQRHRRMGNSPRSLRPGLRGQNGRGGSMSETGQVILLGVWLGGSVVAAMVLTVVLLVRQPPDPDRYWLTVRRHLLLSLALLATLPALMLAGKLVIYIYDAVGGFWWVPLLTLTLAAVPVAGWLLHRWQREPEAAVPLIGEAPQQPAQPVVGWSLDPGAPQWSDGPGR